MRTNFLCNFQCCKSVKRWHVEIRNNDIGDKCFDLPKVISFIVDDFECAERQSFSYFPFIEFSIDCFIFNK